jgi:hypothetical protein
MRTGGVALFCCLTFIFSASACSKKGETTDYGVLACLDGLPEARTEAASPSLPANPSVLWQASLGNAASPLQSGVALSNDRVIVSAAASWAALDRRTGEVLFVEKTSPANYFLSPPAVDSQQRVYVQSKVTLFAYDAGRTARWNSALDTPASAEAEYAGATPTVIGDDVILVSSLSGNRALSGTGKEIWKTTGPLPAVAVGHWGMGHDGKASFVTDVRTGQPAGRLRDSEGRDIVFLTVLGGKGILGAVHEKAGIAFVLLDHCGKQVWALPPVPGSEVAAGRAVVGPGEVAYVQILHTDSSGNPSTLPDILAIDPSGSIVAGPLALTETPWLVGADGTLYALEFQSFRTTSKLVALSPLLQQMWTLDVPAEFGSYPTPALADDGVLYSEGATAQGSVVIAIQTPSPGLARASWPSLRHDNGATSWAGGLF